MKFTNANTLSFESHQRYLNEIGEYSFFHTYNVLDFYSKSTSTENLSFFCFEQKELVAFVSLGLNTKNKDNSILSFDDTPCHLPIIKSSISPRTRKKYLKEIFNEIYKKMLKHNINYVDLFHHPLKFNNEKPKLDYSNSFQILNFFDVEIVTINLNLFNLKENNSLYEQRLYSKLRQEFRKKKYEDLKLNIININNCEKREIKENFEQYKKFHFTSAGKLTRPQASWDLMLDDLFQGRSTLFVLKKDKKDLSFLLCFEHKKYSLAASQANITDKNYLKEYMLRHYLEQKVSSPVPGGRGSSPPPPRHPSRALGACNGSRFTQRHWRPRPVRLAPWGGLTGRIRKLWFAEIPGTLFYNTNTH